MVVMLCMFCVFFLCSESFFLFLYALVVHYARDCSCMGSKSMQPEGGMFCSREHCGVGGNTKVISQESLRFWIDAVWLR